MARMRIVFCGSGDFGLPSLRALAAGREHEVTLVVTQPPRPAGRGGKLRPTPVSAVAEELHLPAMTAEDINDLQALGAMAAVKPDVLVVADFGQMIGPKVRKLAPHGVINLHGSLLPELRGAAPVNWAIIRGYQRTGVSVFQIVAAMDAGPIFRQKATDISPDETAEELRARLAHLGVEAVAETLDMLAAGPCEGRQQDHSRATKASRLKKSDGHIDFSADAAVVRNLIHGTWPWPGGQAAYVSPQGRATPVILARAVALEGRCDRAAGEVREDLTICCGSGRLEVRQIQPAGRRLMGWRDFVNGYRVGPGARFAAVAP